MTYEFYFVEERYLYLNPYLRAIDSIDLMSPHPVQSKSNPCTSMNSNIFQRTNLNGAGPLARRRISDAAGLRRITPVTPPAESFFFSTWFASAPSLGPGPDPDQLNAPPYTGNRFTKPP